MSSLSSKLLSEVKESEDEEESDTGEISVNFQFVEGFRKGSRLVWAFEEQHLFYFNSYSKKTQSSGYTCYEDNCSARIFVKDDGRAFKIAAKKHKIHNTHYETYKHMYCCNLMKIKAKNAPASMTPHEIYKEVLKE